VRCRFELGLRRAPFVPRPFTPTQIALKARRAGDDELLEIAYAHPGRSGYPGSQGSSADLLEFIEQTSSPP
jgi:hypothetical protein